MSRDMTVRESYNPPRNETEIVISVPLNYLNGSMRFELKYCIKPAPHENYCSTLDVSIHDDQHLDDGRMDKVVVAVDPGVISNIHDVLKYFAYVKDFLSKNKEDPKPFNKWSTKG